MTFSLADLCGIHLPLLFPSIVAQEDIERVSGFVHLLPQELRVRHFGFEHSLSDQKQGVDLGFVLNCSDGYVQRVDRAFSETVDHEKGLWNDLIKMFRFWNERQHIIANSGIDWVVLAFDFRHSTHALPGPNLYFPSAILYAPPLLNRMCELFELQPPSQAMMSNLKRCSEGLADFNLDALYLGFMLNRQRSGMRLCITPKSIDNRALINDPSVLTRFLAFNNNPYRLAEFISIFEKIRAHLSGMVLLIDLGDQIGHKIGIECYPTPHGSVSEQKRIWKNIFQALQEHQACIGQEKCEALLSWIGVDKKTYHDLFSTELFFFRKINHLKFVIDKDRIVDTKAYITCDYIE